MICKICGKQFDDKPAIIERDVKIKTLKQRSMKAFKTNAKWAEYLGAEYGVEKSEELSDEQLDKCLAELQALLELSK